MLTVQTVLSTEYSHADDPRLVPSASVSELRNVTAAARPHKARTARMNKIECQRTEGICQLNRIGLHRQRRGRRKTDLPANNGKTDVCERIANGSKPALKGLIVDHATLVRPRHSCDELARPRTSPDKTCPNELPIKFTHRKKVQNLGDSQVNGEFVAVVECALPVCCEPTTRAMFVR